MICSKKSVYMDFRLTMCFLYHNVLILWQAVGLMVASSYWFYFSTWWFSGPSIVKLLQEVISPSSCIETQTSHHLENKPCHAHQKVSNLTSDSPFFRQKRNTIHSFFFIMCQFCFHYVFALMVMTLLTVPLETLSLNRLLGSLCTVCCSALTHHSLSDFIYLFYFIFVQVTRNYKQTEMSKGIFVPSPALNDRVWEWV